MRPRAGKAIMTAGESEAPSDKSTDWPLRLPGPGPLSQFVGPAAGTDRDSRRAESRRPAALLPGLGVA